MGLRSFHLSVGGQALAASIAWHTPSFTLEAGPATWLASLAIAATSAVKDEGDSGTTAYTFTVTRTLNLNSACSCSWAVTGSSGDPANAADFGGTLPSGTVSFASGETSKVITVNVSGDEADEEHEGFTVTLSSPVNCVIGTATATGTIQNDDALPGGLIGLWLGDTYDASGDRPYLPNSAVAAVESRNLVSASRHQFATSYFTKTGSPTITDRNVVGPTGATDAARYQIGAVEGIVYQTFTSLPAGTYTIVTEAMSNTGADQQYRMRAYDGATLIASATVDALASGYTRQTLNFTLASTKTIIVNFLAGLASPVAADIRLFEVALFKGAADLGRDELVGNVLFGKNSTTGQPTVTGGTVKMTHGVGNFGLAQFGTAKSLSAFTVIAVGKRDGAGTTGVYQAALAAADNTQKLTAAMTGAADTVGPMLAFGSTGGGTTGELITGKKAGLWNFKNGDWTCVGSRYDGATAAMFRSDIEAIQFASSGKSASVWDLAWGCVQSSANSWTSNYTWAAMAMWDRALSDAEMRAAYAYLANYAFGLGYTVTDRPFVAFEGDSITWGSGSGVTQSWAQIFGANSSPQADGHVLAMPSATIMADYATAPLAGVGNSLESRLSEMLAIIPPDKRGRKFVAAVFAGTNDFFYDAALSASTLSTRLGEYCQDLKTAGFDKVVVGTMLPRTTGSVNTRRGAFNTTLRDSGWQATYGVDGVMDFAADATFGNDADASNATKYPDGTHPSQTVQTAMEVIARSVINAALA